MPLKGSISARIKEFSKGPKFSKTSAKLGRGRALKQAVAVAIKSAGRKAR